MNLYRVCIKRNRVRGLQMEEDSYLVIGSDVKNAEQIVAGRFEKESITIKGASRVQDGAHLVSETYLVDNFS